MWFISFVLAVVASYNSLVSGFAVAAASAIQCESIPTIVKEILNNTAMNAGIALESIDLSSVELVKSSWLLVGAAFVGIVGAILCFMEKKASAVLLVLVACVACGMAQVTATGTADVYEFVTSFGMFFFLSAIFMLISKSKVEDTSQFSRTVSNSQQKLNLVKGQRINLTKSYPISKLLVGLGWTVNDEYGDDFDLDASVFLLAGNGKVTRDVDVIFYNNRMHPSGSVEHMGDNLTGSTGEKDDEQILVNLKKVPENINRIVFAVTIYNAEEREQDFGQIEKAYIRIMDAEKSKELLRYDLSEDFSDETAVICGELSRSNGSDWNFSAIGNGVEGGLKELCLAYGAYA